MTDSIVEDTVPDTSPISNQPLARRVKAATKADRVIAFFHADHVMEGGTGHVVEKAQDANRRVDCYVVRDGVSEWVGGHQPEVETIGA